MLFLVHICRPRHPLARIGEPVTKAMPAADEPSLPVGDAAGGRCPPASVMSAASKVVVAGGSGALGGRICEDLAGRGYEIVVLTRTPRPGSPRPASPVGRPDRR